MINDPVYKHFLELSWRRKLSPAEEEELRAFLAANPGAQTEWEIEMGLNEVLGMCPDVLVPRNFTARVMQGIEQEQMSERRGAGRRRTAWWRRILPRVALGLGMIAVGVFSWQQF